MSLTLEEVERELAELRREQSALESVSTNAMSQDGGGSTTSAKRARLSVQKTLRRYMDVMSNFPSYEQRREERLSNVAPFSFETREKQKPKSIHRRRLEEDQRRREEELEQHLSTRVLAAPVPPSTFLNKYGMMVNEWVARKDFLARKSEQVSSEAVAQPTRAQRLRELEEERYRRWRESHPLFKASDIPSSVKCSKWEEIQQKEKDRAMRLALRARRALEEVEKERQGLRVTSTAHHPRRSSSTHAHSARRIGGRSHSANPVPDFEHLHRKAQLEMERRRLYVARQCVEPEPFKLTQSRETMAEIVLDMERDERTLPDRRWPHGPRNEPPRHHRSRSKPKDPVPRGTRAHLARSESVHKQIQQRLEREKARAAEESKIAKRRERQAARTSLTAAEIAALTQQKVSSMRTQSKEAKERLDAMQERVKARPPLYAEPRGLHAVAQAREEACRQVMELLKGQNLSDATISQIIAATQESRPAGAAEADGVEVIRAADVDEHAVAAAPPNPTATVPIEKGDDYTEPSSSSSDSDSSSSDSD